MLELSWRICFVLFLLAVFFFSGTCHDSAVKLKECSYQEKCQQPIMQPQAKGMVTCCSAHVFVS